MTRRLWGRSEWGRIEHAVDTGPGPRPETMKALCGAAVRSATLTAYPWSRTCSKCVAADRRETVRPLPAGLTRL